MKITYDPRTDLLVLIFRDDARIEESDEASPGVILDYDAAGDIVSVEVLDAARRGMDPTKVEFTLEP